MSFLDEEIRCEYKVESWRKKLWQIEIDLFMVFDDICKKYDIEYFFIAGSALGATRHKGFIPWDDDIDIGMLRPELDKFLAVAENHLPQNVFLSTGNNEDKRFDGLIRLRDKNSTGVIVDEVFKDCNKGVFIELYPFDNVPNSRLLRKIQAFKSRFYYHALCSYCYRKKGFKEALFRSYTNLFSYNKVYRKYIKNCTKYNKKNTIYVDTPALPMYQKGEINLYFYSDVKETEYVDFEYIKVKIPKGNDRCLKIMFGDYMQLPPIEERGAHHNQYVYYDPYKSYNEYTNEELYFKLKEQNQNE